MSGIWLSVTYCALVFLPLGLTAFRTWQLNIPPRPFWDDLASGLGMAAFAILLAEFLLSGRFRLISKGVGMDVTMRFHQLLARSALAMVVLHPFLFVSPFKAALPFDTTRQLTLEAPGLPLVSGAIAWVLLPAFVLLSIARSSTFKTYEFWRLGHGLGALVIIALVLHHTLYSGRYADDPVIAAVWIALFAVAALSLLSVYLLRPLRKMQRPWTVAEVEKVADRTWSLVLRPRGHDGLSYTAGQFAWINVGHSAFSLTENPFSIASSPKEPAALRFIIKELGDFTSRLGDIKVGTKAFVDGPYGHLTIDNKQVEGKPARGIALIAGGVGIAPMLSILRDLDLKQDPRPVTLLYGNRHEGQIVAREELEAWSQKKGHAAVHVLSDPQEDWRGEVGMLNRELLERTFPQPQCSDWIYVLCGPPAMMSAVEQTLIDFGLPARNILSERFTYD